MNIYNFDATKFTFNGLIEKMKELIENADFSEQWQISYDKCFDELKKKIEMKKTPKYIRIVFPCRYEDEDIPFDFPFRKDDMVELVIDLEKGQIQNYALKEYGDFHLYSKVVDEGCYYILDGDGFTIMKIEHDYVPHGVVPGSWGDYIELDIDNDGFIRNWPKKFDFSQFK